MDKEILARVSKAITDTPNASDYEVLVARNAVKALLNPTDIVLGAIHGCYPDVPDKLASHYATLRWQAAIKAILGEN